MLSTVRWITEFGGVVVELRVFEHICFDEPTWSLAAVEIGSWFVQVRVLVPLLVVDFTIVPVR